MKKYVYIFGGGTADGDGKMKDTLGGKGAGLAEMAAPACRFLRDSRSSTEVCNIYFENNNEGSRRDRRADLASRSPKLEKQMGKKLGDSGQSAAAQRPLRREVLHAGHDEHHPQPRPE